MMRIARFCLQSLSCLRGFLYSSGGRRASARARARARSLAVDAPRLSACYDRGPSRVPIVRGIARAPRPQLPGPLPSSSPRVPRFFPRGAFSPPPRFRACDVVDSPVCRFLTRSSAKPGRARAGAANVGTMATATGFRAARPCSGLCAGPSPPRAGGRPAAARAGAPIRS